MRNPKQLKVRELVSLLQKENQDDTVLINASSVAGDNIVASTLVVRSIRTRQDGGCVVINANEYEGD